MEFSGILVALFKLFFLLAAGYFLNRIGMLDSKVNKGMTSLVVNLTNPALILGSLSATGSVTQGDVLILFLFGIGIYLLLPVLAFLFVRVMRVVPKKRGVAELLLIFGNTGFMAIPVLQTLYGDVAVFYINILNMPFNFLIYTYGIYLLNRDRQILSSLEGAEKAAPLESTDSNAAGGSSLKTASKFSWKLFLSPGILCSLIALSMYFAHLQFPVVLSETFSFVGGVTPPLTMLITGSILAEYPVKTIFQDHKIHAMLAMKLLFFPVLALILARLFFTNSVIIGIICLTFAMPCGAMCAMLSKEYKINTDTASSGVVFSTLLSLITIPIVYLVLARFF